MRCNPGSLGRNRGKKAFDLIGDWVHRDGYLRVVHGEHYQKISEQIILVFLLDRQTRRVVRKSPVSPKVSKWW